MRAVVASAIAAILLSACSAALPPAPQAQASAPAPPRVGDVAHFHDCKANPIPSTLPELCVVGELKKQCTPAADCLLSCLASPDGQSVGGGCDHVCFSGLHRASERPVAAFSACTRDQIPATHEVDVGTMRAGEFWATLTNDLPVWVIYRTPEELAELSGADAIAPARAERPPGVPAGLRPELYVVYGNCPGSRELLHFRERAGFTCDSTGQRYDLAGRPLPYGTTARRLESPAFSFKNEHTLVVPAER